MTDFVIKLVKNIVDNPEDVSVSESSDEYGNTLHLRVNQEDMGRIIGKSGRIIRALRDLVKVKAIKIGVRANLLLEEQQPATARMDPPATAKNSAAPE